MHKQTHFFLQPHLDTSPERIDYTQHCTRLYLRKGSIEEEDVDVIVNPTTFDLDLDSNSVSKAISKVAGSRLQAICAMLVEGFSVNEMKSVLTKACGLLHCKKLLHIYSPSAHKPLDNEANFRMVLYSAMNEALKKIEEEKYKSVSFPLLGFGYPVEERMMAMIEAVVKFGQSNPEYLKVIRVVVKDELHYKSAYNCYSKFKGQYYGLGEVSVNSTVNGDFLEVQPRSRGVLKKYQMSQPWNVTDIQSLDNCDAFVKAYSTICDHSEYIINDIESALNSKLTTYFVQDELIQQFIGSDFAYIKSKGLLLGVAVDVNIKSTLITLSGEEGKVREMQVEISKFFNTIQHANAMLMHYEWRRRTKNAVLLYPNEISIHLEMTLAKVRTKILF